MGIRGIMTPNDSFIPAPQYFEKLKAVGDGGVILSYILDPKLGTSS